MSNLDIIRESGDMPVSITESSAICPICGDVWRVENDVGKRLANGMLRYHMTEESPDCAEIEDMAIALKELTGENLLYQCNYCPERKFGITALSVHESTHSKIEASKTPRIDLTLEKVKTALLVNPSLTPTELAKILGIPRTTINSALDRLRGEKN